MVLQAKDLSFTEGLNRVLYCHNAALRAIDEIRVLTLILCLYRCYSYITGFSRQSTSVPIFTITAYNCLGKQHLGAINYKYKIKNCINYKIIDKL